MPAFQFQYGSLESILLAGSILLVLSVLASRISTTFGVPVLLVFLAIGMLAGSEGPGRIEFYDYSLAFAVGSICLALIMFDGGLRTPWQSVRPVLKLGISLSFVGTVVTGLVTGVFAHYVLNLEWIEAMILGAIVSSTDAAAVFSTLRAQSLSLRGNLKQTLEFEAGSNDPVAIFLTIGMLMLAASVGENAFFVFSKLLVMQGGLGLLGGWLGGIGTRWLVNNIGIEYEGLYGVLIFGLVVAIFSATASLGGSGFLAVYVTGIYLGKYDLLHKGSITRFFDGIAWIAQILVFLTLGLLVYPSHLLSVWKEGLLLALFMMMVARPFSVLVAAPGKALNKGERLFVSWVGLRGAAPVILATLPWSVEFPKAEYFFNLVFFVVLISVMVQGVSIPWLARKAGVSEPLRENGASELSAGFLPSGFINVEILVGAGVPAENRRIVEISLPPGVLLTSLERQDRYLVPRGDTVFQAGDRIWALARPSNIDALIKIFGDVSAR